MRRLCLANAHNKELAVTERETAAPEQNEQSRRIPREAVARPRGRAARSADTPQDHHGRSWGGGRAWVLEARGGLAKPTARVSVECSSSLAGAALTVTNYVILVRM